MKPAFFTAVYIFLREIVHPKRICRLKWENIASGRPYECAFYFCTAHIAEINKSADVLRGEDLQKRAMALCGKFKVCQLNVVSRIAVVEIKGDEALHRMADKR